MASLVEELISIMEQESEVYSKLIECAEEKRRILVAADVPALEKLTVIEQEATDHLLSLSNKQITSLNDVATVLGKTQEKMTVTKLIGYLQSQPDVHDRLVIARDILVERANSLQKLNHQNEVLLKQAIELTEFDITLFKSLRQAPETANYGKDAYSTGTILGSSGFDAKQ